ncbi:metallophosphatase domain-containing protein [Gillisia limnaea]|uniref:Metallophosphoesterase n=1 Tax=Gillisia limnaea (strain DSM 15749 / LMG 21470 / R-8282) TaxID=865937 RepID=H2BYD8_GILLR|nr:metallophosphatase domain-containing protein [Gillisia limnaea]EHQ03277.1 metallophosphoesterase [Gillisia limnaea DSM 15749]
MKIICIADTHNKHEELIIPPGDVIVHAGDITESGTKKETLDFLKWFAALPHPHKILIAGNHDFFLEKNQQNLQAIVPQNIHFLINHGVRINNVNFWGSPVTPGDGSWAFNKKRGSELLMHWNLIPENTDFLITHSPPYGFLDELDNKHHIGCEKLLKRIEDLKIPNHIFGHVHNDYGIVRTKNTVFINSASLDGRHRQINAPLTVNYVSS